MWQLYWRNWGGNIKFTFLPHTEKIYTTKGWIPETVSESWCMCCEEQHTGHEQTGYYSQKSPLLPVCKLAGSTRASSCPSSASGYKMQSLTSEVKGLCCRICAIPVWYVVWDLFWYSIFLCLITVSEVIRIFALTIPF